LKKGLKITRKTVSVSAILNIGCILNHEMHTVEHFYIMLCEPQDAPI